MSNWKTNLRDFSGRLHFTGGVLNLAVLFAATLATSVSAQTLEERVAPLPVPVPEAPSIEVPEAAAPEVDPAREAVLVEQLVSLQVMGDPALFREQPTTDAAGVVVSDLPVTDTASLSALLENYIGQPVTLQMLDEINRDIVLWLREQDLPIADAVAPAGQDITDGHVQVVALVAQRGRLQVSPGRYFSGEDISRHFRIEEGVPLQFSALQQEMAWANRNPFRSVGLQLAPGEEPGHADLFLEINDRFPLRVYLGVDDTGTRATGRNRILAGVNWGNAFGVGHQLGYQHVTGVKDNRLVAHSLSYQAPLQTRHVLSVYLSNVQSRPSGGEDFRLEGKNSELGVRYLMPIFSRDTWAMEAEFGYEFKRSNNNLAFGGERVFDNNVDVSQFVVRSSLSRDDSWGRSSASVSVYVSPGGMTSNNVNEAFGEAREGALADYQYLRANLGRYTQLAAGFSWITDLNAQWATGRLLGSEHLGMGGYSTVRGYDEFAVAADQGYRLRNELRTPGFRLLHTSEANAGWADSLQLVMFVDNGSVSVIDALAGERRNAELLSAGAGVRYALGPWFNLRLDYGRQLKALPNADKKASRVHFSLNASY